MPVLWIGCMLLNLATSAPIVEGTVQSAVALNGAVIITSYNETFEKGQPGLECVAVTVMTDRYAALLVLEPKHSVLPRLGLLRTHSSTGTDQVTITSSSHLISRQIQSTEDIGPLLARLDRLSTSGGTPLVAYHCCLYDLMESWVASEMATRHDILREHAPKCAIAGDDEQVRLVENDGRLLREYTIRDSRIVSEQMTQPDAFRAWHYTWLMTW